MKSLQLLRLSPVVLCFLISASCSKTIYQNKWQGERVNGLTLQEGKEDLLRYYDEQSRLQYNVTNDAENLYFFMRVTDQQNQAKIIRSGMQIWIDTVGKRNKHTALFYPLAGALRDTTGRPFVPRTRVMTGQFQKPPENPLKVRFENEPKEMELKGFRSNLNGLIPLQNEYGITASIDWDNRNDMNYEAVIPFKLLCKNAFTDNHHKPRVYTIMIVIPAPRNASNTGRGGSMGRANRGMGGGMGRGMGGGGGMGRGMGGGGYGGEGRRNGGYGGEAGYANMNSLTKITMRILPASKPQ